MRWSPRVCRGLVTALLAWPVAAFAGAPGQAQTGEPVAIGDLRFQADGAPDLQTVRGIVTHTGSTFYMQDNSRGAEVLAGRAADALRVGDEVEVRGRVSLGRYSPRIAASSLRVLRVRVPDPPLSVTPALAASGDYDRQFVETVGTLVSRAVQDGSLVLWLRNAHQIFTAEQPLSALAKNGAAWQTGSLLKVRGVCLMSGSTAQMQVPFHLLLRSPQDVELLAGPPFWTGDHVFLLSLFLVLLGAVILLVWRRVERWRFALILEERMRVAHDLHDTLAQSFAGIAFQLHSVHRVLSKRAPDPVMQEHVQVAIGMVTHSHEDARRTIAMLKPSEDTESDLLESLRQQAITLTQGGSVRTTVQSIGEPVELPTAMKQVLLRIGHEAITNAVRHAAPSVIELRLVFEQARVRLCVRDDGCGFEARVRAGRGFGLLGMRSRAASQGGSLQVQSQPQQGCSLEVTLPMQVRHKPWQPAAVLKRMMG